MKETRQRECAWYGDVALKIEDRDDWKLYICDHFWVLDIDEHYEFYFHPLHFIGKVEKKQLPKPTLQYLQSHCRCFTDEDGKTNNREHFYHSVLTPSKYSRSELEKSLKVGNLFYAQGENYATMNGRFYKQFPYSNSMEECSMEELDWCMVEDMLRMVSSTRSHHYIQSLFDLHCFRGITPDSIRVKPLQETTWNSKLWLEAYQDCTEQIRWNHSQEDTVELRFMRKEVFQQTVYIVQEGYYYTESGKKVHLPDGRKMMEESKLYSRKISLNRASGPWKSAWKMWTVWLPQKRCWKKDIIPQC